MCSLDKDYGQVALMGSINLQTAGLVFHRLSQSLVPDDTNLLFLKTVNYRLRESPAVILAQSITMIKNHLH